MMSTVKNDIWEYLRAADKPIVLYGTGNGADKILDRLENDGVKPAGVFSSAGFKKNKVFRGYTVCGLSDLEEQLGDMIILVAFGSDRPEVTEKIKELRQSFELYAPDVPVYGSDVFDLHYARQNAEKLREAYSLLCDEHSRRVFENTVLFKLSGDPEYLFSCETERDEDNRLLELHSSRFYLDLGAFTGDTVEEYIKLSKDYSGIVALEPDSRNFRKLNQNTKTLQSITIINSAVSDHEGSIFMSGQHGRGMSERAKTVEIPCTTIDALCRDFHPDYIKMDIEGAEAAAISGGANTIRELHPKMRIACYHRSSDLFELPLLIKELYPHYKLYMRHNPCLPAWDLDYIFI